MCDTCFERGYNDYPKWVGSKHEQSFVVVGGKHQQRRKEHRMGGNDRTGFANAKPMDARCKRAPEEAMDKEKGLPTL